MAKVLRSIMSRRDKSGPTTAVSAESEESDARLQNDGRSIDRRVSISRSGRYKQRDKRRSGIWDNPQLVHDAVVPGASDTRRTPDAPPPATVPAQTPPVDDKENSDAGSVRSKDSVRSCSSVLLDTNLVTQELVDLAEQQLTYEQSARTITVTNL